MKIRLISCIFLLTALMSFGRSAFKCTVKGKVMGRNSKTLFLVKASDGREEMRQSIPIVNNSFKYTFDVKEIEAYELVFQDEIDNGAWRPVIFFPVNGEISFILYPQDDFEKNLITGGQLNKDYAAFELNQEKAFEERWKLIHDQVSVLQKNNEYYSPVRDSLITILRSKSHADVDRSVYLKLSELRKSGEEFTAKGKAVKGETDALQADITKWRYNYISNHTTILSFYLMLKDAYVARDKPEVANALKEVFPKFAAVYPNHGYTKLIGNELNALFKIKTGEPLVDFDASDLAGKKYRLSELAKGKITLVDLWGSWCGPCISATRTMVPVYNEFKDKGFTVVGVAREFKTTKALALALKREKYQWLNLVELDDKNQIWNKYGISNGSGMMILLDRDGKIIAVDPTAEMVKNAILSRI